MTRAVRAAAFVALVSSAIGCGRIGFLPRVVPEADGAVPEDTGAGPAIVDAAVLDASSDASSTSSDAGVDPDVGVPNPDGGLPPECAQLTAMVACTSGALDAAGALAYCEALGIGLALPSSDAESDELSTWATTRGVYEVWLDGSDAVVEGDWRTRGGQSFWSGDAGGSGPPGSYSGWLAGQPSNTGDEDCLTLYAPLQGWNDVPCQTMFAAVACAR